MENMKRYLVVCYVETTDDAAMYDVRINAFDAQDAQKRIIRRLEKNWLWYRYETISVKEIGEAKV